MKFTYQEPEVDREYCFTFDSEVYHNNPGPGTWTEMGLEVKMLSTKIKLFEVSIVIVDGKLRWHEYQKRTPFISEAAQIKAQKLLDNKVFW